LIRAGVCLKDGQLDAAAELALDRRDHDEGPTMTDHADTVATRAAISGVEPQLFVTDIGRSCAFFADRLGFSIVFTYGEPPYYAQVERDAARLNLRCVDRPVIDPDFRDREELLAASLVVATAAEIRQLCVEFQASGVSFAQALREEPWGALDFIIRDPDGNLLLFAGPADR
jgi:catechol 2,3-dioxygenase-like lactoylglutathione lyase family enzyme